MAGGDLRSGGGTLAGYLAARRQVNEQNEARIARMGKRVAIARRETCEAMATQLTGR